MAWFSFGFLPVLRSLDVANENQFNLHQNKLTTHYYLCTWKTKENHTSDYWKKSQASHWNGWSPLQQGWRYRAACDKWPETHILYQNHKLAYKTWIALELMVTRYLRYCSWDARKPVAAPVRRWSWSMSIHFIVIHSFAAPNFFKKDRITKTLIFGFKVI